MKEKHSNNINEQFKEFDIKLSTLNDEITQKITNTLSEKILKILQDDKEVNNMCNDIIKQLKQIFGLYCTLSNNKNSNLLEEFSFLLNWNNLMIMKKMKIFKIFLS